ncbi:MAG: BRO family protein [Desulfobacterales bacterium]
MPISAKVTAKDGNPWWVAGEVCNILGLNNATIAVGKLKPNERSTLRRGEVGLAPGVPINIISEPGLYRLIFRSDKPAADSFQMWVFTEVLPAIRKPGGYRT